VTDFKQNDKPQPAPGPQQQLPAKPAPQPQQEAAPAPLAESQAKGPKETALAQRKPASVEQTMKTHLMRALPSVRAVMPKHLDGEKLLRVALVAVNRTPKLLECSPLTVLQSVMQAAALGLQVDGVLGHGYLVPFNNRLKDANGAERWEVQCQFIPGYKGLIDLARRGGHVLSIEAQAVYQADHFVYQFGLDPKLEHVPSLADNPGEVVAAYAVARLAGGSPPQFDVMSAGQVDRIRERSKTGDSGPWVNDYAEMAKKTVVKRLCKYLPLSPELAAALELDHRNETGESTGFSEILDIPSDDPPAAPAKPQGGRLRERAEAERSPA
jgi:recombination protein RecT